MLRKSIAYALHAVLVFQFISACATAPKEKITADINAPSLLAVEISSEFSERYFDETHAENFARKFGGDAVPALIVLMEKNDTNIPKGKVAIYLGKLADSRAVVPIQEFIKNSIDTYISEDAYLDLAFALRALGLIGDEASLEYLRIGTTREFWNKTNSAFTIPELNLDHDVAVQAMREAALRGYASSGKKSVVDDLSAHPDAFNDFPTHLYQEALKEARRRYSKEQFSTPWHSESTTK
ncbi:MAG: hypothetical protein IT366_15840 [Candidatus Hydrogenedentes bacterium]|nr:hypothetical protein [Candidatus Hydrogenedentota bacterium]